MAQVRVAAVATLTLSRPCGLMTTTPKAERMRKLLTVRLAADEMDLLRAAAEQRQQTITTVVRESLRAAGVPVAA